MKEFSRRKFKYIFVLLFALTILGGLLRFYNITRSPLSLSIDEVAFGYNAYSVFKTGRDEYGKFLPLSFKSTGDYKNPVPIYSMIPSIALFGLNEFSIRFPTALIATLSIPLFFLLFMEVTGSIRISLVATLFLTISPWHIYYSRYVSDHLMALFLVILGVFCLLRMLKTGRWFWNIGSSVFLILSMYTYYAERLFVPLLVLSLLILKRKFLRVRLKQLIVFITVCFIIAFPLIFSTFFGPDRARAQMTWAGNDVEFVRNVAVKPLGKIPLLDSDNLLLFYFVARKYLNYIDPGFLFYSGLNMTRAGTYGLGVLFLFEIPFLILGILALLRSENTLGLNPGMEENLSREQEKPRLLSRGGSFKKQTINKGLIIVWILIGLVPASLTNNEQHPGRTFFILPMLLLISAIGAVEFLKLIKTRFRKNLRNIIFASFLGIILWNLIQALLIFSVHFPRQRGEDFMEGTKEVVEYALANKNMYKEIIFDPYRGIEAPYIVSIPHMYILFYSRYDPLTYQNEEKKRPDGSFGFDKFTIRRIDWREDRFKKDTLFIGSPWSLPEKDIKKEEILKKVYLSGGQLVFFIVSPKY